MPTRKYSAQIIGQVWPRTDPGVYQAAAEALHAKGVENLDGAVRLRGLADSVAATESGEFVNGFCGKQYELAFLATYQADDGYFVAARALTEIAELSSGLREELDEIDRQAEEEIDALETALRGNQHALVLERAAVIALARAAAHAASATACAAREAAFAPVTSISPKPVETQSSPGPAEPGIQATGFGTGNVPLDIGKHPLGGGGGKPGPGNMPEGFGVGGQTASHRPGAEPAGKPDTPTDSATSAGKTEPVSATGRDGDQTAGHRPRGADDSTGVAPPAGLPSSVTPVAQAGGGSGSGFGSPSGGGFKLPSSGGMGGGGGGMPAGLGSGFPQGLPSGGLGGPGSLAPPSAAPLAPAPPPLSTDFSKGFGAGLGSAGAPPPAAFAPAPPPQAPPGAGAPAGAMPTGPAPVAAAGGTPASTPAAPVAAPMPSAPVGGGGMPSAAMGALPPFGSDIPRSAPVAGPAVTPAASGAPSAPAAAGGGGPGSGPVAPVPPGVVGTGVGASAGATAESIRSSLPDPLLESATKMLQQLLHDSRLFPFMDWAVGVFKTRSGVETIINNGDGLGHIPAEMFIPRSARMLFAEHTLPQGFRAQWFAWANPAEPIIAYAKACAETDPSAELWALAVSTDDGGSVMPARAAGVPHFDEVTRSDSSPIAHMAPSSPLDGAHMHRLETVDPVAYVELTGVGDGPRTGQSKAWTETQVAVRVVLERAGMVRELAVPPVIREIMATLKDGRKPRLESWKTLREAMIQIVAMGNGLRPGFGVDDAPATAFVRASHDLTRLCELLLLWEHGNVELTELTYLVQSINSTPQV